MKKVYLLLLLCIAGTTGYAQTAASYMFSRTTGTFTSIVGGPGTVTIADALLCATNPTTSVTTGSTTSDDGGTAVPIGFTFNFAGSGYTTATAGANGVLALSGGVANFSNITTNIAGPGWLMPLWDDLFGTCRTAHYQLSGTPGNQVFTFEWNDWDKFSGRPGSHLFFQVKLFEGTNIIQFNYGSSIIAGGVMGATIGIANSITDFQTLPTTGSSTTNATFTTTVSHPADGDMLQFCPPLDVITGNAPVCVGQTVALANTVTGGTWSSGTPAVATVSGTGVVSGVSGGSATITYMSACGEVATAVVTVNPLPAISAGSNVAICDGSSTTLSGTPSGGTFTWSPAAGLSSTTSATVTATPTITTTYTVTRTNLNGCFNSAMVTVTVNPMPAAIGGTFAVCEGLTTTLTNTSTGGTWTSSNATLATVGSASGVVTGVDDGTPTITYTLPEGCFTTQAVTVNITPIITDAANICEGGGMVFLGISVLGGTWTSSNTSVATVGSTGIVTGVAAGVVDITYMMPSGCMDVETLTVNPLPAAITGTFDVCEGLTTTLSSATAGGTWTSSNTAMATVGTASGIVTGIAAGTPNIMYTLPTGCMVMQNITVNITPAAITGTFEVCEGSATTLSSATAGGTWSSSNGALATVGTSGVVSGIAAGTPNIMYTLPTGCMVMQNVTVNPLPGAITGLNMVCAGSMITLSDATAGGTWSSSNTAVATVGTAGDVTGVTAGSVSIAYTLPTGCMVSQIVTVNPLPVVSGGASVVICDGDATPLTATGADAYSWSPSDGLSCVNCPSPVATPTATTTYTVTGTTFYSTTSLVYSQAFVGGSIPTSQCTAWDAFRASLTGAYGYVGFTIRGSNNTTGISCTDPVVAAAVADALLNGTPYSGVSDGHTWTVGIGCTTGPCGSVAVELSNIGSCACASGYSIRPSINNNNWGGIDGPTCGAASQTMEVVFYVGTGCSSTSTVTVSVNPLPAVYNVTGGGNYCADGSGVNVGLDSANTGIDYQLYYGVATSGAPVAGADAVLDFGLQTGAGTYTVVATNATTGCVNNMAGSATIVIDPLTYPAINIFRSTSDTICDGTHTTFTTSIVDGGTSPHYIWRVNDTVVGPDSVAYDYVPTNGNRVSVTLVSNAVCPRPDTVHSDTITMIVWPNAHPSVDLSPSPNDTVCEGTGITVTATPTYGGYGPTFTWVKNMASVGTGNTYSYIPVDGDDIYLIMNSDYMCRLSTTAYSNVVHMTVEEPIIPSVDITGSPSLTVGIGKPDTLIATVTNGGTNPSYQWFLNGVLVPGATNSTYHKSSFNNGDSVSCMVTRMDACMMSTINSVVITVKNVGVEILAANNNLVLSPNPNKGAFRIHGSIGITADEEVQVEITNMLGQTVYSGKSMTNGGNVDQQIQLNNNIAPGLYILNLHASTGNSVFHFVIAQ